MNPAPPVTRILCAMGYPLSRRRSVKWLPMNPAAPVTSTLTAIWHYHASPETTIGISVLLSSRRTSEWISVTDSTSSLTESHLALALRPQPQLVYPSTVDVIEANKIALQLIPALCE